VNPSVKGPRDRDRLCERLADGTLAAIGTDHAPHPLEEKERPYAEAPSGLPTVDLVLPLLFEIARRGVPLARVLGSMGEDAASCFGIRGKGRLAPGDDADLVLANPEATRVVRGEELPSRSRWSPYEGSKLAGFPTRVLRGGLVVFEEGRFLPGPPPRRLALAPPKPR
jgi:dihydroorotase